MADKGGGAGKGHWPDMRSLRWPPEGVEAVPSGTKASGEPMVPPFELAPDPRGTGAVVAVPIPERPPEIVVLGDAPRAEAVAASSERPVQAALAEVAEDSTAAVQGGSIDGGGDGVSPRQAALILSELQALRGAVEALTAAIQGKGGVALGGGNARAVPVRMVSDHQARAEIQEYFLRHQSETVYPAQIADALNLPVLKVAELCESLAARGQVIRNSVS